MSAYHGTVGGVYGVRVTGPPSDRLNVVLMSEGYTWGEMWQFVGDAKVFADRLLATPPFNELECAINVYRVDVWSDQSGADDPYLPPDCEGTNTFPLTYFDATFCGAGIERLLIVDSEPVEYVKTYWVPWAHEVVILVNSPKQGGSGGKFATVARGSGWDWPKVAIHELGHSFGLGDEYDFLTACDDANQSYTGDPPDWPNVAQDPSRDGIKWAGMVKASTPMPTYKNTDCARCSPNQPGNPDGLVGAFEGAGLWHCGLYRPEKNCLMRFADDFCVVCAQVIRTELLDFRPACLAPVFPASSGFACYVLKLCHALTILLLLFVSWHPWGNCAYRRFLFRLQHCEVGNDNPCIDLGGPVPMVLATNPIPYPRGD